VARDIIRGAVGNVFGGYFASADLRQAGHGLVRSPAEHLQVDERAGRAGAPVAGRRRSGLEDLTKHAGVRANADAAVLASAVDFVLEGLCAQKKISRSDSSSNRHSEVQRRPARPAPTEAIDRDPADAGEQNYN
jgi:magnesium chelatase subunit I